MRLLKAELAPNKNYRPRRQPFSKLRCSKPDLSVDQKPSNPVMDRSNNWGIPGRTITLSTVTTGYRKRSPNI